MPTAPCGTPRPVPWGQGEPSALGHSCRPPPEPPPPLGPPYGPGPNSRQMGRGGGVHFKASGCEQTPRSPRAAPAPRWPRVSARLPGTAPSPFPGAVGQRRARRGGIGVGGAGDGLGRGPLREAAAPSWGLRGGAVGSSPAPHARGAAPRHGIRVPLWGRVSPPVPRWGGGPRRRGSAGLPAPARGVPALRQPPAGSRGPPEGCGVGSRDPRPCGSN